MVKDFVAIIDYGSGNIRSAEKACEHVIKAHGLPLGAEIVSTPERLAQASHIILPGQGAFGDCMAGLEASGMLETLEARVIQDRIPFLGICVGMQLLADIGLEHGEHKGLGWVGGRVVPLAPHDENLKIPHMGWNGISYDPAHKHALIHDIQQDEHYYFVHSFMFECDKDAHILARCDYGGDFAAIVGRDNIVGVQFHPEKSQKSGLDLLRNFMQWQP